MEEEYQLLFAQTGRRKEGKGDEGIGNRDEG
jgi:hypothetical protein